MDTTDIENKKIQIDTKSILIFVNIIVSLVGFGILLGTYLTKIKKIDKIENDLAQMQTDYSLTKGKLLGAKLISFVSDTSNIDSLGFDIKQDFDLKIAEEKLDSIIKNLNITNHLGKAVFDDNGHIAYVDFYQNNSRVIPYTLNYYSENKLTKCNLSNYETLKELYINDKQFATLHDKKWYLDPLLIIGITIAILLVIILIKKLL